MTCGSSAAQNAANELPDVALEISICANASRGACGECYARIANMSNPACRHMPGASVRRHRNSPPKTKADETPQHHEHSTRARRETDVS